MRTEHKLLAVAVVSCAVSFSFAQQDSPPQASASAPENPSHTEAADSRTVALGDPIDGVSPKYPKEGIKQKIQGSVVLSLSVSKDGKVKNVSVLSGDPVLANAAAHAVSKWKYVPYFRNDQPVEVQTTIIVNFKITDAGRPEISAKYNLPNETATNEAFKVGNGVTVPRLTHNIDPEYSEEARQAKYQGTCVLSLIVGPDGRPRDIKVARALGKGLDEKAIEAVREWRFAPATKGGKAVAVMINVQVQFRLN